MARRQRHLLRRRLNTLTLLRDMKWAISGYRSINGRNTKFVKKPKRYIWNTKAALDRLNGGPSQELAFEHWGDRYWYREFGSYHKVCVDAECTRHFLHVSIPFGSGQARPETWVKKVFNAQKIVDFLREQNIPRENILQQDIDYSGYADPVSEIRENHLRLTKVTEKACPAIREVGEMYTAGDPQQFQETLSVPHRVIIHGLGTFLNFGPTEDSDAYEVRGPGPVFDFVEALKRPLKDCVEDYKPNWK